MNIEFIDSDFKIFEDDIINNNFKTELKKFDPDTEYDIYYLDSDRKNKDSYISDTFYKDAIECCLDVFKENLSEILSDCGKHLIDPIPKFFGVDPEYFTEEDLLNHIMQYIVISIGKDEMPKIPDQTKGEIIYMIEWIYTLMINIKNTLNLFKYVSNLLLDNIKHI